MACSTASGKGKGESDFHGGQYNDAGGDAGNVHDGGSGGAVRYREKPGIQERQDKGGETCEA